VKEVELGSFIQTDSDKAKFQSASRRQREDQKFQWRISSAGYETMIGGAIK